MSSFHPTTEQLSSDYWDKIEGANYSLTTTAWVWIPIRWNWWVILQMVTALLGITGNSLVILLLFQRRNKSRSTDRLVGALATADLFTSIFMVPLPLAYHVPSTVVGQIYCKVIFSSLLMWVSVCASIFTLTVIPIERYLAITYPFCFKDFTRNKLILVIPVIWSLSIAINLPVLFITGVSPSSQGCTTTYPSRAMQIAWGAVVFIVEFLLPALLSLILQILTAWALHRQSLLQLDANRRLDRSNPSVRHLVAKRRVLRMLFTVVLLFTICWGPTQICYFCYHLGILPDAYLYSPLYRAINVLALWNSCVNPIIYTLSYPEFRKAVKQLFIPSKRSTSPLFDDTVPKASFVL